MKDKSEIPNALSRDSWISLYDLISTKPVGGSESNWPDKAESNMLCPDKAGAPAYLSANARILAYDIITYLDSQFSERQQRLNLSARQMEEARAELVSHRYRLIKDIWIGKSLLLAPVPALYAAMGFQSPYKRNVSDIHSFLVLVAEKLIEPNPLVKYTRREVPIDDSNSTVDLISYLKSGQRLAYEIVHHSITNVAALAARLEGKGFAQVIFLATDFNVKERVWASIRSAGFDPDFLSTIRCTIFSAIIRQKKELMLKGRV